MKGNISQEYLMKARINVGQQIKSRRQVLNLSQAELAETTGFSRSTISKDRGWQMELQYRFNYSALQAILTFIPYHYRGWLTKRKLKYDKGWIHYSIAQKGHLPNRSNGGDLTKRIIKYSKG